MLNWPLAEMGPASLQDRNRIFPSLDEPPINQTLPAAVSLTYFLPPVTKLFDQCQCTVSSDPFRTAFPWTDAGIREVAKR